MNKKSEYRRQSYITNVGKYSAARCGSRSVLLYACEHSEFDKPEATFTKDQLCDALNLSLLSVKRALRKLREEGSLVPVRSWSGGRGIATTYSIRIVGQGAASDRKVQEGRGEELERDKLFRHYARKYGGIKALEIMTKQHHK